MFRSHEGKDMAPALFILTSALTGVSLAVEVICKRHADIYTNRLSAGVPHVNSTNLGGRQEAQMYHVRVARNTKRTPGKRELPGVTRAC